MLSQHQWLSFTFFALKATFTMSAILKPSRYLHHRLYNATQDSPVDPVAEFDDIS